MEFIDILKERRYKLKGLTEKQIKKIEKHYNITLPIDYKEFLSELGNDGGGFMIGSDCFYDNIFELKEYAEELLKDDNSEFVLQKEHFVFTIHQGYIFMFIDLKYAENSPVYGYYEGDMKPAIKFSSLSDFYKSLL